MRVGSIQRARNRIFYMGLIKQPNHENQKRNNQLKTVNFFRDKTKLNYAEIKIIL